MSKEQPAIDLVPSLQLLLQENGMESHGLSVGFACDQQGSLQIADRREIPVSDGTRVAVWRAPELSSLFRGNKTPPVDIDRYPPEYVPYFFFVERALLLVCGKTGDPTDQQMEQFYSNLRRRPDGRSMGSMHDFLWQNAALLLGMYVLSKAEFEGIFGALSRSAAKWSVRPISRNYIGFLKNNVPH